MADEFGEAKLFRPNRDTRFSKDKSPYKTNIAAVIYQEKGGSVYVSLAAEGLHVGGGSYHLERPQLARLREAIDDDRTGKQIERHRRRPPQGQGRRHRPRRREDRAPRLLPRPPPHRPAPPRRPGGMFAHQPAAWLHTAKAKDRVVDGWHQLQPLNDWLAKHL